jgi:GT2 family glycosyltransferase
MPDKLVAVIPAYNGAAFLPAALASLQAQSRPPDEIVVVDNHSHDATRELVRGQGPRVLLVELDHNQGFGRACNRGIQLALDRGAGAVLLVNQDLTLHADACLRLSEILDARPDLGMVSAFLLTYDGGEVEPDFRPYMGEALINDLYFGRRQPVYEIPFVPAAAVLVRRALFEEIGGFDPLFFMYGEDNDLCRRAVEAGWKIGLAPAAAAHHWGGKAHARPTLAWQCQWTYSLALRHLKGSRRPLPLAFASLFRHCPPRWGPRGLTAWLHAVGRCLLNYRAIGRHRRDLPHAFEPPPAALPARAATTTLTRIEANG